MMSSNMVAVLLFVALVAGTVAAVASDYVGAHNAAVPGVCHV